MVIKSSLQQCFLPLLGISSLLLLPGKIAQAQVGIAPMVIREEINRNRGQGVLTVNNPSAQPIRIRMYAEPFTYDRNVGFTPLAEAEEDLTPYLQFSPREFEIPPNSRQRVRLVALFPPDMSETEYRAIIFSEVLRDDTDEADNRNTTTIQTRVGATVYFRQNDTNAELSVISADWDADKKQIGLLINNVGPATAHPFTRWELAQAGETVVSDTTSEATVLAEGERVLPIGLGEDLSSVSPGTYDLTGELIWIMSGEAFYQPFNTTVSIP